MTDAERKLWSLLRGRRTGAKFRRQVPYGPYILDFYCVKAHLIIEVDGSQHCTEEGKRRDWVRDDFLRKGGLDVLRFSNIDVLTNSDGVITKIAEKLSATIRHGSV